MTADEPLSVEAIRAYLGDLATHVEARAETLPTAEAGAHLLAADRLHEAEEYLDYAADPDDTPVPIGSQLTEEELAADARREMEAEAELDRRREEHFDRHGYY